MKKIVIILFALSGIFACVTAQNKTSEEKKFESLWEGKLNVQSASLRFALKIYKQEDGSLAALADSPDQSAFNLPVEKLSITPDSLKFEMPAMMVSYKGKLFNNGLSVSGIFKQGAASIPLNFARVEKLSEAKRPQTPVKPYPYNEEEVTFVNSKAGITLAGTLTYPKTGNSFTAVVLVTGSGRQDRDETILAHKPFLVIADYLTRSGYAVLRYDDRGAGKSQGNYAAANTEDLSYDALAAVEYLKTRKEINKIGIMGHSEGGEIAPLCASRSKDAAFIVLLAGPGLPGKDILLYQQELAFKAANINDNYVQKRIALNSSLMELAGNSKDSAKTAAEMDAVIDNFLSSLNDKEKKVIIFTKASIAPFAKEIMRPWLRFFIKYDPRGALEELKIPVLAINGEKDTQVDPKLNLPEIEKALKKGGNNKYKIAELPGLNHLFQTCKEGTVAEYGKIEETFSPKALEIIKDWLNSL